MKVTDNSIVQAVLLSIPLLAMCMLQILAIIEFKNLPVVVYSLQSGGLKVNLMVISQSHPVSLSILLLAMCMLQIRAIIEFKNLPVVVYSLQSGDLLALPTANLLDQQVLL